MSFATEEEAIDYMVSRASRESSLLDIRVVESGDPVNYRWVMSKAERVTPPSSCGSIERRRDATKLQECERHAGHGAMLGFACGKLGKDAFPLARKEAQEIAAGRTSRRRDIDTSTVERPDR